LGGLRQEDCQFEAILGYIAKSCFKKSNKNKMKPKNSQQNKKGKNKNNKINTDTHRKCGMCIRGPRSGCRLYRAQALEIRMSAGTPMQE
jgi:hypothetical protein